MKKVLVSIAVVAMMAAAVSCGNCNKKAAAAQEEVAPAVEQADSCVKCDSTAAPDSCAEAPAETPAE